MIAPPYGLAHSCSRTTSSPPPCENLVALGMVLRSTEEATPLRRDRIIDKRPDPSIIPSPGLPPAPAMPRRRWSTKYENATRNPGTCRLPMTL